MKPFSFWRFSETVLVVSLLGAPAGAATEKVLYSFCSQQGCADGQTPYASLINVKGTLYGTTLQGGANLFGTLFSITPDGKEKVVYSFGKARDAETPGAAKSINVKGTLYGTTYYGGAYNDGTVFSFDLTTGTEHVLHSFGNGTDGIVPHVSLINVNGTLYGTTSLGGANGGGTVFSITP